MNVKINDKQQNNDRTNEEQQATSDVWRKWIPDELPDGRFWRNFSLTKISCCTVCVRKTFNSLVTLMELNIFCLDLGISLLFDKRWTSISSLTKTSAWWQKTRSSDSRQRRGCRRERHAWSSATRRTLLLNFLLLNPLLLHLKTNKTRWGFSWVDKTKWFRSAQQLCAVLFQPGYFWRFFTQWASSRVLIRVLSQTRKLQSFTNKWRTIQNVRKNRRKSFQPLIRVTLGAQWESRQPTTSFFDCVTVTSSYLDLLLHDRLLLHGCFCHQGRWFSHVIGRNKPFLSFLVSKKKRKREKQNWEK